MKSVTLALLTFINCYAFAQQSQNNFSFNGENINHNGTYTFQSQVDYLNHLSVKNIQIDTVDVQMERNREEIDKLTLSFLPPFENISIQIVVTIGSHALHSQSTGLSTTSQPIQLGFKNISKAVWHTLVLSNVNNGKNNESVIMSQIVTHSREDTWLSNLFKVNDLPFEQTVDRLSDKFKVDKIELDLELNKLYMVSAFIFNIAENIFTEASRHIIQN